MKLITLVSLFIMFSAIVTFGQTTQQMITIDGESYTVSSPPTFPGGPAKFSAYINDNLKYPKDAKKQKIEGRVLIQLLVDSTGFVVTDSTKVVQSLFESCDIEAIRLINNTPKWVPGWVKKLDKSVPLKVTMPVNFIRK